MGKVGEAISHGAVTIVNALATGKGAALGVSLSTKARVKLTDTPGQFALRNLMNPREDNRLMLASIRRVLMNFKSHRRYGAIVETESNIPVAVGLKSSSAASNAIALATVKALGQTLNDQEIIDLGVDASFEAGVTKTGAYDDALACYFGGLFITDNVRRRILTRFEPHDNVIVLVKVPRRKSYTEKVDRRRLRGIRQMALSAHREALKGNYWYAMTLNGLAYSAALGIDVAAAEIALEAGAISAGLTGKGPAVAAIVPRRSVRKVLVAWKSVPGRTIQTSLNFEKANAWMGS